MRISAKAKTPSLYLSTGREGTQCSLCFHCSPADGSAVLEIGQRHVFANRTDRPFFSTRRSCHLVVYMERKSELVPGEIEKLELSDSKVGNLAFVPPDKKRLFWRWRAGVLSARVFVSDELFAILVGALSTKRKAIWLNFYIEKKGALEWGWEPDASRMAWKLESTTEPSHLGVSDIEIEVGSFR